MMPLPANKTSPQSWIRRFIGYFISLWTALIIDNAHFWQRYEGSRRLSAKTRRDASTYHRCGESEPPAAIDNLLAARRFAASSNAPRKTAQNRENKSNKLNYLIYAFVAWREAANPVQACATTSTRIRSRCGFSIFIQLPFLPNTAGG